MFVKKGINVVEIIQWTWHHMTWLLVMMLSMAMLYRFEILSFSIPWLPVSVIGTAVAFYVGFKNNQSYDRLWEARKIWGAIINSSRSWGMQVDSFVTNFFADTKKDDAAIKAIKKRLIYRHIAWIYTLRGQLLIPAPWEHVSQGGSVQKFTERTQRKFGIDLMDIEVKNINFKSLLPAAEYNRLINQSNTATQIISEQSRELTRLREEGLIEDFRHIEMAKTLSDFYVHQGKCERIKKFPLPRQYANMSRIFVGIFIFLLPFSMIPELMKLGDLGLWLSVPITALVGWIYVMMEIVGDYSEHPFQGMPGDIPMLSLCRTIEIDLMEMLGEKGVPEPIKAKNNILM